jgi:integral membrane protein
MTHLYQSGVGRLRIIGYLEGVSLILLLFIAVPLKYAFGYATLTKVIGTVHGILFLLFIVSALSVGVEQCWKFKTTTWKVLVACLIPFGTFYIDRKILRRMK